MPAFSSVMLGVAAAASIGGTVNAGIQASNQADEMRRSQAEAEKNQNKLLEEAKTKKAQEQANLDSELAKERSKSEQDKNRALRAGRSGTILTSPLGEIGASTDKASKTLLGG